MIGLPFEIRESFPFFYLREPMENIVAWNFWILIIQTIIGILLVLYLRKIVESFQVKARTLAAKEATFYFRKKDEKQKDKPKQRKRKKRIDSAAQTKKEKKVKKEVVHVAKQDKKNRKTAPKKQKQKRKRKVKSKDPFANAQEID